MKKLFSTCLMAMAMATMSAEEVPFTVTPADGSTVESFTSMVLELKEDSGFSDFEVATRSDIYFTHNGEFYCGLTRGSSDGNPIEFAPAEAIVTPGEYSLVIEPSALGWWSADYSNFGENSEQLVYSFTLAGGNGGETPADVPFIIADPEPGSTVYAIYYVDIDLNQESGFTSIFVKNEEGIYFNRDGKLFTSVWCNALEFNIEVNPETPITLAGEYELVIEPGAIAWTDGENEYTTTEKLVYKYYVEEGEKVELPFNVNPEAGSTVGSLSEVTLTLKPGSGFTYMGLDSYGVYLVQDYEPVGILKVEANGLDSYTLTVVNEEGEPTPITEPGVYDIVIEEFALNCGSEEDDLLFFINYEPLFFTYTVGAGEPEVVYDVIPSNYKPDPKTEVDLSMRDFNSITLSVPEGILPTEDAVAYIYTPDSYFEAPITKVKYMNQLMITFDNQQYNGEYEVYIPEGSFGDETWHADHAFGHANPEISLYYTLVNGKEPESNISYTLVPEVSYTTDYSEFTLKFEEGVMMDRWAFATFTCEEAKYSQYAEFFENEDNTFSVTFEAPAEPGNYVFYVERGMFGDAEFIESWGEAGIANDEISMVIEVTTTGISSVSIEAAKKGVYSLGGVKVADSVDGLPAGVYVVDGKKVAVK